MDCKNLRAFQGYRNNTAALASVVQIPQSRGTETNNQATATSSQLPEEGALGESSVAIARSESPGCPVKQYSRDGDFMQSGPGHVLAGTPRRRVRSRSSSASDMYQRSATGRTARLQTKPTTSSAASTYIVTL